MKREFIILPCPPGKGVPAVQQQAPRIPCLPYSWIPKMGNSIPSPSYPVIVKAQIPELKTTPATKVRQRR
ncbi:unnamed protein product [Camellia sinensis]